MPTPTPLDPFPSGIRPMQWVRDRLPNSGGMRTLRRKSTALYTLTLVLGTTAYLSAVGFLALGALVTLGSAGHAVHHVATGSYWDVVRWFLFAALSLSLVLGTALLAARWVGKAIPSRDPEGGDR